MPRFKARRAAVLTRAVEQHDERELSQFDRRARAYARIWPLLSSTSIPTHDLCESLLDELVSP